MRVLSCDGWREMGQQAAVLLVVAGFCLDCASRPPRGGDGTGVANAAAPVPRNGCDAIPPYSPFSPYGPEVCLHEERPATMAGELDLIASCLATAVETLGVPPPLDRPLPDFLDAAADLLLVCGQSVPPGFAFLRRDPAGANFVLSDGAPVSATPVAQDCHGSSYDAAESELWWRFVAEGHSECRSVRVEPCCVRPEVLPSDPVNAVARDFGVACDAGPVPTSPAWEAIVAALGSAHEMFVPCVGDSCRPDRPPCERWDIAFLPPGEHGAPRMEFRRSESNPDGSWGVEGYELSPYGYPCNDGIDVLCVQNEGCGPTEAVGLGWCSSGCSSMERWYVRSSRPGVVEFEWYERTSDEGVVEFDTKTFYSSLNECLAAIGQALERDASGGVAGAP
ncbi:MAG: hypothetical protein HY905_17040 [Deltaproteobacteria bacterium]|nr:hypothetical protein [Deltaproteobacteria bacterium]